MLRIGVIGFGFSGRMVVANLLRAAAAPFTLYIIDDDLDGFGVAYGTKNLDHLLNVRAGHMSAFADEADHFTNWLMSDAGKLAAAALGITGNIGADDFAPRALYAAYLESIWRETQQIAHEKTIAIKLVPSRALAIHAGEMPAILTERGDVIALDKIILAVGHESKPLLPQLPAPAMIQDPWAADLADAVHWPSPVMLVGTGLTAVDILLSLRRAGYAGDIVAASFSGSLPQPHAKSTALFAFSSKEIASLKTLSQMLRLLRSKICEVGQWRVVIDALRPYTQTLWQLLSPREQQRFLARLTTRWITHRHRMAPQIAATIDAEIAAGTFRLIGCNHIDAQMEEGQPRVTITARKTLEHLKPTRVINCAGLELNLAQSRNNVLRQILADGIVEAHVTNLGIVADPYYRAWGALHPNLYVIGSLLTGQLLESTAVPELRTQAAVIAQSVLA